MVSSSSSALSHSVFGPIGSDFASRLPLSKSASAANLGERIKPVLRIRDILVRIRASVRDPYLDPAIFVFDLQDGNKNTFFAFFLLFTF